MVVVVRQVLNYDILYEIYRMRRIPEILWNFLSKLTSWKMTPQPPNPKSIFNLTEIRPNLNGK